MGHAPLQIVLIAPPDDAILGTLATLASRGRLDVVRRLDPPGLLDQPAPVGPSGSDIQEVLLALLPAAPDLDQKLRSLRKRHTGPFLVVAPTADVATAVHAVQAGADLVLAPADRRDADRLETALATVVAAADQRAASLRAGAEETGALQASESRLRALCAYLQSTVESERKAIAREIHDDIGGILTALRFDLEWIWRHADKEIGRRALHALEGVTQAVSASQRISRQLRPPVLEAGVIAALEWQVEQFRQRTGMTVHFASSTVPLDLDDRAAVIVYRCVQEALTNIVKHAQASTVKIDLVVRDGLLSVEIRDDGKGLSDSDLNKPDSFGLRGLAERAHAAGGWLDLSPSAHGTTVLLTLPVRPTGIDAEPGDPEPAT